MQENPSIPLIVSLTSNWEMQRFCLLSSSCMLVYEYLLTFDEEVSLIWNCRQSAVTLLFFAARYATPISMILDLLTVYPIWTVPSCHTYIRSMSPVIAPLFILSLASWITILRTYALYTLSKRILISLAALWVVATLLMALVLTGFGKRISSSASQIAATTKICLLGRRSTKRTAIFWAAQLVLDTTVFVLTVRKTAKYTQHRHSRNSITGLINVYLRDGAVYYVGVCGIHLLNFLITFLASPGLKTLGSTYSQSVSSVLVCRLVLSLRKESKRRSGPKTSSNKTNASFRDPEGRTTWPDDGFLSSCAIASFFNINLDSELGDHEETPDPPSEAGDEHAEQDLPSSEGIELVTMERRYPTMAQTV
ncbi:hypothetical protein JB92DRAFT_2976714 [Gautieria morchelliformis]|nr:hypothetical protein JB92DRAFT_2976714 [Gautieria morchelliformis]